MFWTIIGIAVVMWGAWALAPKGNKDWYEWGMTPGREWNEGEKL